MEYHKYVSEMEVALDWYPSILYALLYRWNNGQKGEEKCRDAFHDRMELEYYCARLQNHHLVAVRLYIY